jgi:GntR family transcriptional repressor for pyruvate dehydrogenase complex
VSERARPGKPQVDALAPLPVGPEELREADFEQVLRPLLAASLFTRDGVGHLLEVRKVLEAESARLAALRAENGSLMRLRDDLRRMNAAVLSQDVHEVDTDFHVHVAEASENPLLASITKAIFSALGESFKPSRQEMVSDCYRRQAFVEQHAAIVAAIEARDPEAAREAMYVHLAVVEREVGS